MTGSRHNMIPADFKTVRFAKGVMCRKATSPYYYYRRLNPARKRNPKAVKHLYKSTGTDNYENGIAICKKWDDILANGGSLDEMYDDGITFGELVDRFSEYSKIVDKESTFRGKRSLANVLKKRFGNFPAREITRTTLTKLKTEYKIKGKADNTARNLIYFISGTYSHAMHLGLVKDNPADKFRFGKVRSKPIVPYSREELDKLIYAADSVRTPGLKRFIQIMAKTGMRMSEQFRLRWSDIDFRASVVLLKDTKARKDEEILIDAEIKEILKKHKREMKQKNIASDYVFCKQDGQMRTNMYKAWKTLHQKAGVDYRGFHPVRHTTCTELIAAGIPDKVTRDILRQKTTSMTDRYAHLKDTKRNLLREAIAVQKFETD